MPAVYRELLTLASTSFGARPALVARSPFDIHRRDTLLQSLGTLLMQDRPNATQSESMFGLHWVAPTGDAPTSPHLHKHPAPAAPVAPQAAPRTWSISPH